MNEMKNVLIVEDDNNVRELLRESLIGEGFHVQTEHNLEWALKTVQKEPPDVLICDLLLPDGSGFDLIEAFNQHENFLHVVKVVISGVYREKRYEDKLKSLGIYRFLEKPFEVGELISCLKQALGDHYPGAHLHKVWSQANESARYTLSESGEPFVDSASLREQSQVEDAARELRGRARNIRGHLRENSFPQLLCQIFRWRASGALLLQKKKVKKIIYFEDGYPVFVKSNVLSECLGRVLVQERMITETECTDSIAKMKETGRQQGTVLLESGCLSPHNLVYGLQLQMETKIYDIFAWDDGAYQFSVQAEIPAQTVQLSISVASLIFEGVKRYVRNEFLLSRLKPHLDRFVDLHSNPLHRFQQLNLMDEERQFVAMMNGRHRMRKILERGKLDKTTSLQLMYSLLIAEMIELRSGKAEKPSLVDHYEKKSMVRATPPPLTKRAKEKRKPSDGQPDDGGEQVNLAGLSTDELRRKLTKRLRHIKKMDHFEVLGLSSSAASDEVRRSYFALSQDIHPDKLRGVAAADVLDVAEQIHNILTSAYDTLINPEVRKQYEQKKREDTRTGFHRGASLILLAESHFRAGENKTEESKWDAAVADYKEAIQLYPREGEFYAQLGWALYHSSSKVVDDVFAAFTKAIELSPQSEKGYLNMARILSRENRQDEAITFYESAIQCNPDNRDAIVELKALLGS